MRQESTCLLGECLEIESCHSQGDTIPILKKMLKEALDLTLDEPASSNLMFPTPNSEYDTKRDIVSISVDNRIAFALLVRQNRISKRMTKKEVQ